MSWNEIAELVVRAQNGDRQAYGQLVELFYGVIRAAALKKLRNADEADDLTQEVFAHGMQKIGQLRNPGSFLGWLKQIVDRMAINRLTRKKNHQAESDFFDSVESVNENISEQMSYQETLGELIHELNHLSEMDRQALDLFYLKELNLKQISEQLDIPVGTVKRRLFVARERLRDRLAEIPNGCFVEMNVLNERGKNSRNLVAV